MNGTMMREKSNHDRKEEKAEVIREWIGYHIAGSMVQALVGSTIS